MVDIARQIQSIIDKNFKGNQAAFARALEVSPTTVASYLSPKKASKPTSEFLGKLVDILGINPSWLLLGQGEMDVEKDSIKVDINADSDNGSASAIIGNPSVGGNAAEHDELIRLREENKFLRQMIAEKDETIAECRKLVNHFIGQG